MSIADHFERAPDAGFIRDYDAGAARRQFTMSMMLIVIIAAAAAALSVLVRFDGPAAFGAGQANVEQANVEQVGAGQSGAGQIAAPPRYAGKL